MATMRLVLLAASVSCLLRWSVVAAATSWEPAIATLEAGAVAVEELFEYDGDSHYEFGLLMGERFRDKIRERVERNAKLQTLLLPYARTAEGKELYRQYLDSHSRTFPVRDTRSDIALLVPD